MSIRSDYCLDLEDKNVTQTLLRQVLGHFENSSRPLLMPALARELNISDVMLAQMIQYWVKKGKLREVNLDAENCASCGVQSSCPFIVTMPRMYEIVSEDETLPPRCCCN